ncbi:MAG: acyl-CoA dehydrogenase family protein, partial [Gemmatimonadota bacterium]
MDDSLFFSEPHHAVRDMVRQFAREQVAPIASRLDADSEFLWESIPQMAELGLLGVPWPEEVGGAGFALLRYILTIHELAMVEASHSSTVCAPTTLGTSRMF